MNWKTNKDLFVAFFRAGILGYGGGPASIPLFHKEAVERYRWVTDEEFGDILALGNALPGPIATKMAGYIGYRLAGWSGLASAILATVLPTVLLMIGLMGLLTSLRDSAIVQGMTQAITPVVAVMMLTLTYSFFKQSKKGLGLGLSIALVIVSLLLYQGLALHPAVIIGALLAYGLLAKPRKEKDKDRKKGESA
ncbi:chromate transporter [Halalkalibacter oceani]|uniref:Chromate transporter n=1 Tax=Halalkalibacter oceani TaxID=1653776 RepID=A0A9X2IQD1_9BACI|nr:chromate transporter [Halalkalibacter oceani]MCM3714473.1 chromate transporter [Halalkalibacter oceani]